MTDLTIFNNKNLTIPAYTTNPNAKLDVGSGIHSGLPYIKLHGNLFQISEGGEKVTIGDSIMGVIVGAGTVSKRCYLKAYAGVGGAAPDCASFDGVKPDEGIEKPVALKCAACEYNAWGSEVTPAGGESKKCKDYRRLAFCIQQKDEFKIYRFDVPPASLGVLKQFGMLATTAGVPLDAIFTKISFDPVKLHKLKFDPLKLMPLEQHEIYKKLTEDPRVREILTQKTSSKMQEDAKPAVKETIVKVASPTDTPEPVTETITNIDNLQDIEAELNALTEADE